MMLRLTPMEWEIFLISCVVLLVTFEPHHQAVRAEKVNSDPLECDIYIAESTIPNAGLGVFTAVEKKIGDFVGNGDVCFPMIDLDLHNGAVLDPDVTYFSPFEDYVWDGNTMGMGSEAEGGVTTLWPGLDCAINCNIPLENVQRAFPLHKLHGDEGLDYIPHRSKDPGAGSITPYRSGPTRVIRDIPKGGELFKFYGDNWFLTRNEIFEGLPLQGDFPKVQHLINRYDEIGFKPLYNLLLDIQSTWEKSRTLNALPQTDDDLKLALEKNITYVYQANATRSLEWLQEHGKCIDHIVHKPSTIPGAGEGGFAKRRLPKGTLITGSPLMHIPNPQLLDMYKFERDEETDEWLQREKRTKQVVLNYCLGHKDSTLLLFPYGSGINYINHASGDKANVRMEWAQHGTSGHDSSWLEKKPEDMEFVYGTHLGIDYFATRDIEEGEELFLDYGPEWEEAWKNHVESWKPPEELETASDWNIKFKDAPVLTEEEVLENPYPNDIQLRCHVNLVDEDWKELNYSWARYERFNEEYQWVYGLPCSVLHRSPNGKFYTVELIIDGEDHLNFSVDPSPDNVNPIYRKVPREAMFYIDGAYTSDLHLENTFRHPINIPAYMMPEAWKNKGNDARDEVAADSLGNDEL